MPSESTRGGEGRAAATGSGGAEQRRLGTVLDRRYRIDAVLGVGGLGVVYRAQHVGLGRPVAIKVLHDRFGGYEEIRRRFDREAQALAALDHDHIVAITDYGTDEGTPYLAMELLEGPTLAAFLSEHGAPEPDLSLELARQMLSALAFAHDKGVLHRDLKPANVLLLEASGGYHSKIVDFGLAKLAAGPDGTPDPTLTADGTLLGTPAYMSPEQAAGMTSDARSDVYSMGIVLYEMLCGRPPFVGGKPMGVLRAHLSEHVSDPSEWRPGLWLSPALDDVLRRALAKRREERFADAAELLQALGNLPRPAVTMTEVSSQERTRGLSRRSEATSVASAPTVVAPSDDSIKAGTLRTDGHPRASVRVPRTWWVAGGALALAAGVATVGMLTLDVDPESATASSHPGTTEASAAVHATDQGHASPGPAGPSESRPAAADPFSRPVPRSLRSAYRAVKRGRPLSRERIRTLQEEQQSHRDDPRPSLLLAHDFAGREWYGDALTRYEIVHEIDPAARGSQWMLRDLVRIATISSHDRRAADLVARAYGSEALAELDRSLAEDELGPAKRQRLRLLRERLSSSEIP